MSSIASPIWTMKARLNAQRPKIDIAMDELDPFDLSRALSDIPLFREFQRLVAAGSGAVNLEIAGQIAKAVSSAGTMTMPPGPDEVEGFESSVRVAEMRLTEASGLSPSTSTRVEVLGRQAWAEVNLKGSSGIVSRLAQRLGLQIAPAGLPAMGMTSFFEALGPLFMGIQVGFLIGHLSRQSVAQFDLCFPLSGTSTIHFNIPNIRKVEEELEINPESFRMWLCLHEVAHRMQSTAIGWVAPHLGTLLDRYVDSAEVDPAQLMSKLEGLTDLDQLNNLMSRPEELLPMMMGSQQSANMEQIRVMLAVLEGHADLIATQAGGPLLPEMDRIKEGMTRRRAEKTSAERLLERLLGIDVPPEIYRQGVRFVQQINDAGHLHTLMSGPDTLPNAEEIAEPSKWLTRVAFG